MAKTIDYKGYLVSEESGRVRVGNVKDFDPVHTFECGQCFRWHKEPDGSYTGVAFGRVANVKFTGGILEIGNATLQDFKDIWFEYFDLGRDYSVLKEKLAKDSIMEEALRFGHGIRLLKQEFWETLISFIISTNNNIPRIMRIVASISEACGEELVYRGEKFYSFPGVLKLAGSGIDQLAVCRGGYRCRYILRTSRSVKNGDVNPDGLSAMSTDEARKELMKLPGVGEKVADCTLLYSGTKYDVFPTDVWVRRAMGALYFKREASFKEIQQFAKENFGELAGFAQQYLFYYARENNDGYSKI